MLAPRPGPAGGNKDSNGTDAGSTVRYEPDENPPVALTFGLGLQLAILTIAGIVLTPAIVVRAGGGSEDYLVLAQKQIRVILINELGSGSDGEVCAVVTRSSVGRSLSLV